ncbi:MAG: LLM class F420-dependent oxidoreductase [Pseudomonadota bacterium]
MKIGAVFPHQEIGSDPIVLRDWAQAAEELGYGHLLVYDHVLGAVHEHREPKLWGPYTEHDAFHEPMVLFGYFAACTRRVELVTGILILPQRQTVLAAKQAAQVDLLSGGRLRLGIGTGWNYVEYDSLNEDFRTRGRRQEEQVDLMRRLWAEPVLDYHGAYHRVDRAGFKPLPGRQIPIWFGGFAPVAFHRAARLGDGFIFGAGFEQNREALGQVRTALDEVGRSADTFGIEALVNFQAGPEARRAEAEAWHQEGADYIAMRAMALRGQGDGLNSPQAHIDALQTYWDEVGDLAS